MEKNKELEELKEALEKEKKRSKIILLLFGAFMFTFGIAAMLLARFLPAFIPYLGLAMTVLGIFRIMDSFNSR